MFYLFASKFAGNIWMWQSTQINFVLIFFPFQASSLFFASGAYAPGSRIAFPSFHALVTCDHARIIWDAVRVNWPLPPNNLLIHNVKEWLLHVLAVCSVNVQARIIMLIWRIWQLPNDVVHGKQIPPLQTTVDFLDSYFKSLQLAQTTQQKKSWRLSWLLWLLIRSFRSRGSWRLHRGLLRRPGGWPSQWMDHTQFMVELQLLAWWWFYHLCSFSSNLQLQWSARGMVLSILSNDVLSRSAYGHLVAEIKA